MALIVPIVIKKATDAIRGILGGRKK
jgi:hypothetical protein